MHKLCMGYPVGRVGGSWRLASRSLSRGPRAQGPCGPYPPVYIGRPQAGLAQIDSFQLMQKRTGSHKQVGIGSASRRHPPGGNELGESYQQEYNFFRKRPF